MCGIVGFVDKKGSEMLLTKMVDTLHQRGPDDRGHSYYHHDNRAIGLGHTRLSIIDLTEAGHQPMSYSNFEIVFNGEIYNYKSIRTELIEHGHSFKTESDTEVILHAFDQWGKECVHRFVGMFAFAIYDKKKQQIYCCRDRAGIKPFYFYQNEGVFLFASELKAFHVSPSFKKKIDMGALGQYFHYGFVPTPFCIFHHTFKLNQGHWLTYDIATCKIGLEPYWSVNEYYNKPKLNIDYSEARDEVEKIMSSACHYRMVADVPVGVFLSGGYDSSAVTALLQKDRTEKLKTFTIGFEEGNNEAPFAEETANYLGTDHTTFYCTTKEAQEIIPKIPYYYDEPFADSSSIPTMLVSREARKQVTVALSADAGDETFIGYDRYLTLLKHTGLLSKIPNFFKPFTKAILYSAYEVIPAKKVMLRHQLNGAARALNKNSRQESVDLYRHMLNLPQVYYDQLFRTDCPEMISGYHMDGNQFKSGLEAALAGDYTMYLQDDILTKVDRATMSVSLEGREPLLDHRLIEFSAQLPIGYKFDGTETKKILKDIVHRHIPKQMMDRPKTGFSLPIYSWLKQDLNYLFDEYFREEALEKQGIFDVEQIIKIVSAFQRDKFHYKPLIWKLLMFQMWYRQWM